MKKHSKKKWKAKARRRERTKWELEWELASMKFKFFRYDIEILVSYSAKKDGKIISGITDSFDKAWEKCVALYAW